MGIPSPLAFPPTALRNVAAGLVVGNPIGSSGSRAKALTTAELKAIVEASAISYLPLAGGTLTGELVSNSRINASVFGPTAAGTLTQYDTTNYHLFRRLGSNICHIDDSGIWIRTATGRLMFGSSGTTALYGGTANLIEQRNDLNSQCFDLFETYTSVTNNGKLRFKATSSGHQIGSARATSGSNRAVQLGHFDSAGTFTSGLSVATNGEISTAGNVSVGANAWKLKDNGASSFTIDTSGGTNVAMFSASTGGEVVFRGGYLRLTGSTGPYLDMTSASAIGFRTNAGGYLSLTCGQISHFPPTSTLTLATNGLFSIEMTSNTAGNLVYRGSDGTTRRMALTFV